MLFNNTFTLCGAATATENAALSPAALEVPVDAKAEEIVIPVNQAERCSVCQQWIPTAGGTHNCPGKA
ncbi:hypothetical protein K438DRAFT_1975270 [Mycena galopus ATCC 62051]|nr:hypothetical protein K438DRAFT_1975270 [Mycena galopus ATCC 62051]